MPVVYFKDIQSENKRKQIKTIESILDKSAASFSSIESLEIEYVSKEDKLYGQFLSFVNEARPTQFYTRELREHRILYIFGKQLYLAERDKEKIILDVYSYLFSKKLEGLVAYPEAIEGLKNDNIKAKPLTLTLSEELNIKRSIITTAAAHCIKNNYKALGRVFITKEDYESNLGRDDGKYFPFVIMNN